jgi:hypothetical protein
MFCRKCDGLGIFIAGSSRYYYVIKVKASPRCSGQFVEISEDTERSHGRKFDALSTTADEARSNVALFISICQGMRKGFSGMTTFPTQKLRFELIRGNGNSHMKKILKKKKENSI